MRKIAEGAEAEIYECYLMGILAVAKRRRRKPYLSSELDEELRLHRTRNEARVIGVASEHGINVPVLLMAGADTLFMRYVAGEPLARWLSSAKNSEKARVLSEAGSILVRLHELAIAHGDYTPANMMVDSAGRLWLIDFGLSVQMASVEEKALDVLLFKRSLTGADYSVFLDSYSRGGAAGEVLKKLAQIERRGRYQTRSLFVVGNP